MRINPITIGSPDWTYIELKFPLAFKALKKWFIECYDIPESKIIIEHGAFTLINNKGQGVQLNTRDLYDFFDIYKVRPFVIHVSGSYPQCKFLIQTHKSEKNYFGLGFESRIEAEIAMFTECFDVLNKTFEYRKNNKKAPEPPPPTDNRPKNIEEAVEEIYSEMKNYTEFINEVKTTTASDFAIKNHHGLGTNIRNNLGLWNPYAPIRKHFDELGYTHADDMSSTILLKLHEHALKNISK